ncbi:MAG: Co2+/Mg2+ efflux protein ApaG [Rickettsiaceae bacterium]|jgi:ApaG protein|nr:Co2+/Mg2+ efflux protein ApaG [Rickettsiaceae bacterium]
MYSKTTNFITIDVEPEYEEEQSMPSAGYYIWEYSIRIKNNRTETVQLINRHWVIIDDKGQVQEVSGPGVVGVQPILRPGEEFEYASSVHLNTPSGVMMGNYEMLNRAEELFKVEIPAFSLDCPHVKIAVN